MEKKNVIESLIKGLNPCFNGRCTSTIYKDEIFENVEVLILVLMEDALVQQNYGNA